MTKSLKTKGNQQTNLLRSDSAQWALAERKRKNFETGKRNGKEVPWAGIEKRENCLRSRGVIKEGVSVEN